MTHSCMSYIRELEHISLSFFRKHNLCLLKLIVIDVIFRHSYPIVKWKVLTKRLGYVNEPL